MSGSGNDFILVDNRAQEIPADRMVSLTRPFAGGWYRSGPME